jgi:tetratricopeptide (TPR) repeat protein
MTHEENTEEYPLEHHLGLSALGRALRRHRRALGLTQAELAERAGISADSVSHIERGVPHLPRPETLALLIEALHLSPEERAAFIALATGLRQSLPSSPSALSPSPSPRSPGQPEIWNVPYPRNPFFTGREDLLQQLHEQLWREQPVALAQSWAISGLGGIGKTQIALEYAYRYRQEYRYVFWINAATRESLLADMEAIADLLGLPEQERRDQHQLHQQNQQNQAVQAVRRWFATHEGWLLILDNADDVALAQEVAPLERTGHLLLTSRAQALGTLAKRLDVEEMGMVEGTLFLLRRANLLTSGAALEQATPEQQADAEAIVIELGFLPLALDQAGAFLDEVGCALAAYLDLYRSRRRELLQRRSHLPAEHPDSVATTWSLSFAKVERRCPAAAELLRLCAFLEPDTIPEDLFSAGSAALSPVLQRAASDILKLNETIEEVRKFSLLQRHPDTGMLRIHRLVQAVLRDEMSPQQQRRWAERAVRATQLAFPARVEMATSALCLRYLAQAQACSALITDYAFTFAEAASLLYRTALYLHMRALFAQAEPLLQCALHIWEQAPDAERPRAAHALNALAALAAAQGDYAQAETLYQQALHIREEALGLDHPGIAPSLNNLADLSRLRGDYAQAEALYHRAVRIWEQASTPGEMDHPKIAHPLMGLAHLALAQGDYAVAQELFERALRLREQAAGPEHAELAQPLCGLADAYRLRGDYAQAETLYRQALALWEQAMGPEHPELAHALNGLADLYRLQGDETQAEPLYRRALRIWERALGPTHPDVAHALSGLAALYAAQGDYPQAASLYQRALAIREQALGAAHPTTTATRAKYDEALHGIRHHDTGTDVYAARPD